MSTSASHPGAIEMEGFTIFLPYFHKIYKYPLFSFNLRFLFNLRIFPSPYFDHDACKHRPYHLKIPGGPKMARAALSQRAVDGPNVSKLT